MCCRNRHVRRSLDHGKLGNMIAAQPVQTTEARPSLDENCGHFLSQKSADLM